MAKPNYSFEKRQKEIAKKQKKEAKLLKKSAHVDEHTEKVTDQNDLTQPTIVKDVS